VQEEPAQFHRVVAQRKGDGALGIVGNDAGLVGEEEGRRRNRFDARACAEGYRLRFTLYRRRVEEPPEPLYTGVSRQLVFLGFYGTNLSQITRRQTIVAMRNAF
jgi:hypothetical protein